MYEVRFGSKCIIFWLIFISPFLSDGRLQFTRAPWDTTDKWRIRAIHDTVRHQAIAAEKPFLNFKSANRK